ncbi:aminoacyl-tRNA hydrolase [Liquorilactobacillus oeni]|uniref:Peptidyl-tRNA hydrolase n=1 Tax=Liquorilactobacillus oeni DSM 19972 TaxID=1423777 RepID=A0A0R1MDK2_9LACO|nr:aminoacyl-tRNA hydrolase [Liquorilactobacillus oeni]KRL06237.1 peptidyl-trna hydrolase (pth) [Liquorilactobacillus oeni DSM 19972]
MKLIVGLGNIGKKYEGTRHNVGFMTVENYAKQKEVTFSKLKHEAEIAEFFHNGEKIILAKPTTYMNESGRSVKPLMKYSNVDVSQLIVIHDDMDLPIGHLRLRPKGSAGGHNGIKSIIAQIGTQEFKRVRIGIDHPQKSGVVDWVLTRFSVSEKSKLDQGIEAATAALDDWIENEDFVLTMNKFNHK